MAEKLSNGSAQFLWNDIICNLYVEDTAVHLKCTKAPPSNTLPLSSFDKYVEIVKVISTTCEQDTWNVDEQGEPALERPSFFSFRRPKLSPCFALIIYFWSQSEKHCRKFEEIKLQTKNEKDCIDMQTVVQEKLHNELQKQGYVRPHNLLIFLNPIAGKRKSQSLHKNLISPMLRKAGIKETVVTTQYPGHVLEYLESADLSVYDGIVAVGGDGTFSEIVNGVLKVELLNKHGDSINGENNLYRPFQFSKPSMSFGCISSGSSNVMNCDSQGTNDPETGTLQIICGENHPLNVSSFYDDKGKLLTFSVVLANYGYASDYLATYSKYRRFGPARGPLCLAIALSKLRPYPFEMTCITSSSDQDIDHYLEESKCRYPCDKCNQGLDDPSMKKFLNMKFPPEKMFNSKEPNEQNKQLSTIPPSNAGSNENFSKGIHGNLFSLSLLNIACAFHLAPQGLSPTAHLSDGKFDIAIFKKTTKKKLMNAIVGSMSPTERYLEYPVVTSQRMFGMHFRVPEDDSRIDNYQEDTTNDPPSASRSTSQEQEVSRCNRSYWIVDGDKAFDNVNITVWMHKGLINIFSKGHEKDLVDGTSV